MSTSKQMKKTEMNQSAKLSMEPILQDYSISSLSEMNSGVAGPSDSSLFENISNYDVALPNLTLNQTDDVNMSSDQYPPDTTMMDLIKVKSPQAFFKKPFASRSNRKPRPSLFDKDLQDSENSETPEPKVRKPFQRKAKVAMNENEFENVFNSSNDSITHLDVRSNFITRRKKRMKKNIESSLFDKDLNSSESDRSFSLRRNLLQRKINKKTMNPSEFDDILNESLNGTQTDESQPKIKTLRSRLKAKQKNVNPELFDNDLNSSDSIQDSAKFVTSVDKEVETVNTFQENQNCIISDAENKDKNSCIISEPGRLLQKNNVESFANDSSSSSQQLNNLQINKKPFKNILKNKQTNIQQDLFDNDLNTSESFQHSVSHASTTNNENCTLTNLKNCEGDLSNISDSNMLTSESLTKHSDVGSSVIHSHLSSYSLQLYLSSGSNGEIECEQNKNKQEIENKSSHLLVSPVGEEIEISLKNKTVNSSAFQSQTDICVEGASTNKSEIGDKRSTESIVHLDQNVSDVRKDNSLLKFKECESNVEEIHHNDTLISDKIESNTFVIEKFKSDKFCKSVPDKQNDISVLNLDNSNNKKCETQQNCFPLLQENQMTNCHTKGSSRVDNCTEPVDNHKEAISECNESLGNKTLNRSTHPDITYIINELDKDCNGKSCTTKPSLSNEHSTESEKLKDGSNIDHTNTSTKTIKSPLQENVFSTIRSEHFSGKSLQFEKVSEIHNDSLTNVVDLNPVQINPNISIPNIDYSGNNSNHRISYNNHQLANVNYEAADVSNLNLQKRKVSFKFDLVEDDNKFMERRSTMNTKFSKSNCSVQALTPKANQSEYSKSEFSLFVDQSSKSVTSDSVYIDIHPSQCKSTTNINYVSSLSQSDQPSASNSARDSLRDKSIENEEDDSADEGEFEEAMEDETAEEESVTTTDNEVDIEHSSLEEEIEEKSNSEMNAQDRSNIIEEQSGADCRENQTFSEQNIHLSHGKTLASDKSLQDHSSSFKVPKKPSRNRSAPKKPHPIPLNNTKVQEILDNLPYSELKRKKRKPIVRNKFGELNLPIDNVCKQTNPRIITSKLKKPQKWVTPRFYEFIIKKLTPQFGIKSRVTAEKVVSYLVENVSSIMMERDNYFESVEEVKKNLASLGIIQNHLDFRELTQNYFDGRFFNKLFPLHDVNNCNPFEPDDLSENIL